MLLRFIDDLFMIQAGTEERLKFIDELNQKQKSIKFDFKYSKTKIQFLDALVYRDINNKLQTTLYKKLTDRQSYLHANSGHLRSLRENIAYSQTLRVHFVKRGYEKSLIENQVEKVAKLDRSVLLAEQNKSKKVSGFPLSVTYNRTNKHTSTTPASVKNRFNIRGDISTNPNTSISQKSKPEGHHRL